MYLQLLSSDIGSVKMANVGEVQVDSFVKSKWYSVSVMDPTFSEDVIVEEEHS